VRRPRQRAMASSVALQRSMSKRVQLCGAEQAPQSIKQSASAPLLPAITRERRGPVGEDQRQLMLSRAWTTERRRLLHERRQRQWLRSKAKHGYVDFSDAERAELRRYFDALAEDNQRIRLESLEDLFISLGAADTRDEVLKLVAELDEDNNGELDFEEYLEIVRNWTNANITQARLRAAKAPGEYEEVAAAAKRAKETTERLKVFMAMMQGKLGDRNLNFKTVISNYRRSLMFDATGARGCPTDQQARGSRILHNFAALQRNRHQAVEVSDDSDHDDDDGERSAKRFDEAVGPAPLGSLGMVWRGVCHEHNLVSSRPTSSNGKHRRRSLERPLSPSQVVASICKINPRKVRVAGAGQTVIVHAPAREESGGTKDTVG